MMELREYTPGGVHEKVLSRLESLPKGTVLDVPSGQGALSRSLEAFGFKVFSGDIEIRNILYRNSRCVQLNLNHLLPFNPTTFDYVVCTEGIEHIENPHHLIREFGRLIRKDGYLILTTPNVMTIKSRLRFLFYSYLDYFRYIGPVPPEERHRIEEHEHQHLNPLSYPEIKFILQKYGFAIERIETNRMVKRWKLFFPLIKLFTKYKTRKKFPKDPFYISDMILEGEDLIVIAKKSDERND